MNKQQPKQDKAAKLRRSLVQLATAGATLCTTLMVLGVFGGGTGPKIPASLGE